MLVPTAIAYDLVLEDRALARQGGVKRQQRPFTAELAEMMTMAVGYRTRAFVTFGEPIPLEDYNPESRKDVLDLAHRTREVIGRLYKVRADRPRGNGHEAVHHAPMTSRRA